jgi:hypothetical protein
MDVDGPSIKVAKSIGAGKAKRAALVNQVRIVPDRTT